MKKLLIVLSSLWIGNVVYGAAGTNSNLKVSSGTFLNIDLYENASGNYRQAITVGSSSFTATAPVDPVTGLTVNLASSTLTNAGINSYVVNPTTSSITGAVNVTGSTVGVSGTVPVNGTFFQSVQPVYVNNPTTSTIQGSVTVTPGTGTYNMTGSTIGINGTVPVAFSGSVTVTPGTGTYNTTGSTIGISGTVPVSGTFFQTTQPISGNVGQVGTYTVTAGTGIFSTSQIGSVTVTPGTGTFSTSGTLSASQAVSFSTLTTTAVLSSTMVTTSVLISTPVAGLSSQTIRVFRLIVNVDTATNITFRDGSTNFGDTYYLSAGGSIVLDLTNAPWYITSSSNGFVIKQSGTANISALIFYTQS